MTGAFVLPRHTKPRGYQCSPEGLLSTFSDCRLKLFSSSKFFCETCLCKHGLQRAVVCYIILLFLYISLYAGYKLVTTAYCPPLPPDSTNQMEILLRKSPKSVAVVIQATGKYLKFALELIDSGRKFLCQPKQHECSNVTYLLFTDAQPSTVKFIPSDSPQKMLIVHQKRLGWPDDTMKRYHTYLKQQNILQDHDFILALDADMRFASSVSLSEIFGDLVGVMHPAYFRSNRIHLPYEQNEPRSKAYVPLYKTCRYYAGGVWGGRSENFLKALRTLVWQLDEDAKELGVNFTAAWHDESHLNKYFLSHPPTRVLWPCYCHPEHSEEKLAECDTKILALDKDYSMRDV